MPDDDNDADAGLERLELESCMSNLTLCSSLLSIAVRVIPRESFLQQ
jgi:hypothetical protein